MPSITLVLFVLTLSATASPYASPYAYARPYPQVSSGSTCDPKNSPTALQLGKPVPMKKEDIPTGCSDFEILVGIYSIIMVQNVP
jgi:hypothetical protein